MRLDVRRRARLFPSIALGIAGALGGYAACGDSPGQADLDMASPTTTMNFQQINDQILHPQCANLRGCHNDQGGKTVDELNLCSKEDTDESHSPFYCGPDSSLRKAYDALVGKPAVNKTAAAEGKQLVVPCDPDASFLMLKLLAQQTSSDSKVGYGLRMPKNANTLPAYKLKAISDWIARGARFDEPEGTTGTTCRADDMSVVVPMDMSEDLSVPADLTTPPDLVPPPDATVD